MTIDAYVELGPKKAFASAVQWPGWSRSGRDEPSALAALVTYGPRYAAVARRASLELAIPRSADEVRVVKRVDGGSGTDFGVPEAQVAHDAEPIERRELGRLRSILEASWATFDDAVERGTGRELRKGPRGGGRELDQIVDHVVEAEAAYLRRLPWKAPAIGGESWRERVAGERSAVLEALEAMAPVGQPEPGPRGGRRWPARYFVRRAAWHVLDHAWEIEDRTG